jgi:small subunit ribosomal protein S16
VAVKIRLKRFGKIRAPYYRIVVADSRTKRDGRVIEEIGKYHPTEEPSLIEVDSARAQYWLGVGAQPSEQVEVLLKITGDWQTFKGLPGTEGTLRTKAGSADTAVVVKAAADAAEKAKAKASAAKEAAAKEAKDAKDKAAAEAAAATAAEAAAQEAPAEETPAEEAPAEETPAEATDEQA